MREGNKSMCRGCVYCSVLWRRMGLTPFICGNSPRMRWTFFLGNHSIFPDSRVPTLTRHSLPTQPNERTVEHEIRGQDMSGDTLNKRQLVFTFMYTEIHVNIHKNTHLYTQKYRYYKNNSRLKENSLEHNTHQHYDTGPTPDILDWRGGRGPSIMYLNI